MRLDLVATFAIFPASLDILANLAHAAHALNAHKYIAHHAPQVTTDTTINSTTICVNSHANSEFSSDKLNAPTPKMSLTISAFSHTAPPHCSIYNFPSSALMRYPALAYLKSSTLLSAS